MRSSKISQQLTISSALLGRVRRSIEEQSGGPELHGTIQSELHALAGLVEGSDRSARLKIKSLMFEFEALRGRL